MSEQCITVTPTIMDGTVARWYASEQSLLYGFGPVISASRNGVMAAGGDYLQPETFERAWAVHVALRSGQDVEHLATHRRRGLTGPYERIEVHA